MKYLPTILLAVLYVLGIAPVFIKWPHVKQNWYLGIYDPMYVSWNVRYMMDQIQWIVFAVMGLFYWKTPNLINRTSMTVLLLWAVIDTFYYFYNDKTFGYWLVWGILAVAWFLIYRYKRKKWTTQTRKK